MPTRSAAADIFEPRYLSMFEDALGRGRVLGIIQPGDEAAEDAAPLQQVDCWGALRLSAKPKTGA